MLDSPQELLEAIRRGEDSRLELKSVRFKGKKIEGPDRKDLADELAAFANSDGGVCVLGVDDESRQIEGIPPERLDDVELWVRNITQDLVEPPLMGVSILRMELPDELGEDRTILKVEVARSFFAVHRSPRGYYHRKGSGKYEIPHAALVRLIQSRNQSGVIRFDESAVDRSSRESLDEELWLRFLRPGTSEDERDRYLRKQGILTFDEGDRERASVAGLLMASWEPHEWLAGARIVAVRYRGTRRDANYQVDTEEIVGPLDVQIDRAVAFVDRTMRRFATKRPDREETPQFSIRAVFEAVVNAVAHRDYSITGSRIRLFVFDDRLELFSPGGLPNTLEVDSLPLRQATRNELLTTLLSRLQVGALRRGAERPGWRDWVSRRLYIEKRGEGVPIILETSRELSGREPEYELIDGSELLLTIWGAPEPERPQRDGEGN